MCYLVLKEQFLQDLVAIEKRSHLVPSRTQKLSSLSADIAKSCLVKYAPVSYTHLTLPTICSV